MTSTNTVRSYGTWFKSSYSGDASGNCLEACQQPEGVSVRDAKRNEEAEAPALRFGLAAWSAFTTHARGSL